ncbi:MAG: aminodeoxychorismate synthase component I [Desulfovermiculus sp.]|nr:aminodeoxychorismate synthase component I [Desulfovermiculus sp.]
MPSSQTFDFQELTNLTGIWRNVHSEELPLSPDMFALARSRSHEPGCVFLASGGDMDSAQYHILAVRPWYVLQAKGHDWIVGQSSHEISGSGSPLPVIRALLLANRIPELQTGSGPARAGLFGYLGYELGRHMESLPCTSLDDSGLPDLYLTAPSIILTQDVRTGQTWVHIPEWNHPQAPDVNDRRHLCRQWIHEAENLSWSNSPVQAGRASSSLNHDQYLRAVQAILEYIRSGHVYQVNLSQRLVHSFSGSAFDLFAALFQRNPAPFYAFIQAGEHQVVSTSPERFLAVQDQKVETRPIKGTRPRGKTPDQDLALAQELQKSDKDGAELAMIVDLMRNDLGRVCAPGSVRVAEHKRLEAYDNVYHLVSIVQGDLEPERSLVDLLQATFPGGSITGCPKIRAMEIIDELEPFQRHVYTGSIGYLGFDGRMDLSIAIRTAVASQGRLVYSVGGGVVIDSDPEDEYQETWHKGRTFAQVLSADSRAEQGMAWVWYNGHIIPESDARCSLRAPAVEYGFGIFETLRADGGRIWFCPEHVSRMSQAWEILTGRKLPRVDWETIISRVLEANKLKETAAIKIYAGRGVTQELFCVSARAYTHRLAGQNRDHLDLMTHPEPRQSFLAGMKTCNHLVYILAGEWAKKQGADEALIVNPDGTVSETNSANIILLQGSKAIIPQSPHVLAGIMQTQTLRALIDIGFAHVQRPVFPQELFPAEAVFLTNSLLGVLKAGSLDGKKLSRRESLVRRLNETIFGFQPI